LGNDNLNPSLNQAAALFKKLFESEMETKREQTEAFMQILREGGRSGRAANIIEEDCDVKIIEKEFLLPWARQIQF
jgi:hypothetical protein